MKRSSHPIVSAVSRTLRAAPKWLAVTLIICAISYLFGFFSEMGADHYYETLGDDACGSGKEGVWL